MDSILRHEVRDIILVLNVGGGLDWAPVELIEFLQKWTIVTRKFNLSSSEGWVDALYVFLLIIA